MEVKEELYKKCIEFIDTRLHTIQNSIKEIHESLLSETKSSAGDKHETGRAMLQLEREKAGNQLAEIMKVKGSLSKIDVTKSASTISLGSVVYTSGANYFVSISAGVLQANDEVFYAISSQSPIGQLLMGKTSGDEVVFRGQRTTIKKVI